MINKNKKISKQSRFMILNRFLYYLKNKINNNNKNK